MPRTISLFKQNTGFFLESIRNKEEGKSYDKHQFKYFCLVFLSHFCSNFVTAFPELYVVWLWYKTFTFWFNMKFIRNCSVPWKSWAYTFLFSTKRFCHYSFISLAILAYYDHTCQSFFPSPLGNRSGPEKMFAL